MSKIKLMMTLLVLMSCSSIAYSQTINIQKETKQEIVTTLKMYPLVLKELDIKTQLLGKCNEIRGILELEIQSRDTQINLLSSQIGNLEKQKDLFSKQLRKSKSNQFKLAGIGVATIIGIIIIK